MCKISNTNVNVHICNKNNNNKNNNKIFIHYILTEKKKVWVIGSYHYVEYLEEYNTKIKILK